MRRYWLPLVMLGVTAAVLYWAWSLLPAHKGAARAPQAVAPRVAYSPTQPLTFELISGDEEQASASMAAWLRDELSYWFPRAPQLRYVAAGTANRPRPFAVQARLVSAQQLQLRLLAPDGFVEREKMLATQAAGLPFAVALAQQIPRFLGLNVNWQALIGTSDADAYAAVVRTREHLRAEPTSVSLDPEQAAQQLVVDIGALERVTKRNKQYARAWSTLALAYSRMEGEDSTSLDSLALAAAERAIALDPKAAEAHAVRGFVQYQRGQWLGAHAQLMQALQLEPASTAALTILACLLVDAGLDGQALPVAEQAVKVAPADTTARECLSYARIGTGRPVEDSNRSPLPFAAARLVATVRILEGNVPAARQSYAEAIAREHRDAPWLDALLNAASDRKQSVEALRAITSAASEGHVDATTEVLAGVALKRSDFVFNRLLRLQHANEFAPLRVLWLPQTTNLRKHASFDDVLRASNLATFWARHGKPDVCAKEPRIAACREATLPSPVTERG
ncbi:MAG: hypothetical protein ABW034_22675 [Steroidobacteraceae bacterium]